MQLTPFGDRSTSRDDRLQKRCAKRSPGLNMNFTVLQSSASCVLAYTDKQKDVEHPRVKRGDTRHATRIYHASSTCVLSRRRRNYTVRAFWVLPPFADLQMAQSHSWAPALLAKLIGRQWRNKAPPANNSVVGAAPGKGEEVTGKKLVRGDDV